MKNASASVEWTGFAAEAALARAAEAGVGEVIELVAVSRWLTPPANLCGPSETELGVRFVWLWPPVGGQSSLDFSPKNVGLRP